MQEGTRHAGPDGGRLNSAEFDTRRERKAEDNNQQVDEMASQLGGIGGFESKCKNDNQYLSPRVSGTPLPQRPQVQHRYAMDLLRGT